MVAAAYNCQLRIQREMPRKYYSVRTGRKVLDIEGLRALFRAVYLQFREKQFLDEGLGFTCVDAGLIAGTAGQDPGVFFMRHLRKNHLWPILDQLDIYSEDDLFDVIELLYDLVSEPTEGTYHSYSNCGMHYEKFNQPAGQAKFRSEINDILADYKHGFELAENGEIVEKADRGLDSLLSAKLPQSAGDDAAHRMEEAIGLFRKRQSSATDRRNAVRMLADLFEHLRPKLHAAITKNDERDLFNIANNFAIRHHNDKQKTKYDESLWLSWMFYFYLGTLHLAIRRLDKAPSSGTSSRGS